MRQKRHLFILLALLAAIPATAVAAVPVDFNEARLQSGRDLYLLKRYLEAIDQFRVAAFGYLDQPSRLSESLARLALAEEAAGRPDDAKATVTRFLEVQRRFPSYPPKGLEPETGVAFQAFLLKQVPESTLKGIPSLASLVETEEQKIARLPPAQRRGVLEAAARREPGVIAWPIALARDDMQKSDFKGAEKWAQKALAIDPGNPDARIMSARARISRGQLAEGCADLAMVPGASLDQRPDLYADVFLCDVEASDWAGAEAAAGKIPDGLAARPDVVRAQQRLREQRGRSAPSAQAAAKNPTKPPAARSPAPAPVPTPDAAALAARSLDVLTESRRLVVAGRAADAQKLLTDALQAEPGNRDLRLALLEAACLSRAYSEGASQVSLVSPFRENEAPSMFYAAVVLYETGKADEARGLMKRAVPRVSGPLVDEYSRKILGP